MMDDADGRKQTDADGRRWMQTWLKMLMELMALMEPIADGMRDARRR